MIRRISVVVSQEKTCSEKNWPELFYVYLECGNQIKSTPAPKPANTTMATRKHCFYFWLHLRSIHLSDTVKWHLSNVDFAHSLAQHTAKMKVIIFRVVFESVAFDWCLMMKKKTPSILTDNYDDDGSSMSAYILWTIMRATVCNKLSRESDAMPTVANRRRRYFEIHTHSMRWPLTCHGTHTHTRSPVILE